MSDLMTRGCLCGKVSYQVPNNFKVLNLCHCTQCRKITSSAHASNLFRSPNGFKWTSGETDITKFKLEGRGFSAAFCAICGSGLPFMSSSGKMLIVPAGSLDEEPNYSKRNKIFCSEQADWSQLDNQTGVFDHYPQ